MTTLSRLIISALVCVMVAACGGSGRTQNTGNIATTKSAKRGLRPYEVFGVRYYPKDDRTYSQRGVASWYGPNFHGKRTANGDRYDMYGMTAAHKTLPLGSYIKVTNLENGRAVILLINDRGPFAKGRIVDVSKRAAQILGFERQGITRALVERTDRSGRVYARRDVRQAEVAPVAKVEMAEVIAPPPLEPAAGPEPRLEVPQNEQPLYADSVTAPPQPALSPEEPTQFLPMMPGPVLVQVASFADFYNARRLQQDLADIGPAAINQVSREGRTVYRVQIGPYGDLLLAEEVLAKVHARGHSDATLHGVKLINRDSR